MDQIIFDDLRFEIDEKINKDKMSINQECYSQNKQTLEGAGAYAECYQKRVIELAQYERRAKLRLLFLNLKHEKKGVEFNLTEEVGAFIKEFGLQAEDLLNEK